MSEKEKADISDRVGAERDNIMSELTTINTQLGLILSAAKDTGLSRDELANTVQKCVSCCDGALNLLDCSSAVMYSLINNILNIREDAIE